MQSVSRIERTPVHGLALAAIMVSVVAGVLALYGSLVAEKHIAGSPLNVARGEAGLVETQESKVRRYSIQIVAFVLPLLLGVGASLLGGEAMKAIEKQQGAYSGNLHAVFAIMIGGLAAVVAGCMTFAVFVWKSVPSFYSA